MWPSGGPHRKGVITVAGPGPGDDKDKKGLMICDEGVAFQRERRAYGCDFWVFGAK